MKTILAIAALALFAPAAAQGATLTTDHQCYIEGQKMGISGTGWAPGSQWGVRTEQIYGFGTADPAGNFSTTDEKAPVIVAQNNKPKTFTLSGEQDGTAITSTTFQAINFIVKPASPNGKPTRKTKWQFGGFFAGQSIFFHIKRGGKTYTSKAGKAHGACGTLTRKLKRLPGVPNRKIHNGTYKVFVDNRRKFKRGGLQFGPAKITVY
jgi:hypothetical protein